MKAAINFEAARRRMVEEQLKRRGLKDERVLAAMLQVPREEFVPKALADSAYDDCPLPIGEGQTISQPYMVALMTEMLGLKGDEKVLEIGTGSGYQAAILACLCRQVYTVERIPSLVRLAKENFKKFNFCNIMIKEGDGSLGWPEFSPYQGIMVACAAAETPPALIKQLDEKGRLLIPLGGRYLQELTLIKKGPEGLEREGLCGCVFVPLVRNLLEGGREQ